MSKPLSKIVRWVLVALAVALLACLIIGNRKGRRMSQCVIAFPDSLECIYDGIALTRHLDVAAPPAYKLVMVVDSLQCSYCKIGRLQRYKDLFEESLEEGKFDLVVILSPKRGEAESLREFLLAHDFSLPIYLDSGNTFLGMNRCIPSDVDYHSFLLDASGHPVFIGDPLKGNRSYKKFERLIGQD